MGTFLGILFFGFLLWGIWKCFKLWIKLLIWMYDNIPDDRHYEDDDEEYGYESSRSEGRTSYIVQFKGSFGDWCDTGFDTKYENAGQNKFDDYVRRNPNARCRLVEKRNGKVVAVLDTN